MAAETIRGACCARRPRTGQPGALQCLGPDFAIGGETDFENPGPPGNTASTADLISLLTRQAGFPQTPRSGRHSAGVETVLPGFEARVTVQLPPGSTADAGTDMVSKATGKIETARPSFILACIPGHPLRRGCAMSRGAPARTSPMGVSSFSLAHRGRPQTPCPCHLLPSTGRAKPLPVLRRTDELVTRAEHGVAGKGPVKRRRLSRRFAGPLSVSRNSAPGVKVRPRG